MKGREMRNGCQLFDGERLVQPAVYIVNDLVDPVVVDGGGFVHWGG